MQIHFGKLIKGFKVENFFALFDCLQRLQFIPSTLGLSCTASVLGCQAAEGVMAEDGPLNPAVFGQVEFEAELVAHARLGPE